MSNPHLISNKYLQAQVTTQPKEVYGAIWIISDEASTDFYSISNSFKNKYLNTIPIRTTNIPEQFKNQGLKEKIHLQIYAFDKAFLDYYKTRNDNNPIRDVFLQGSGSIIWNGIKILVLK